MNSTDTDHEELSEKILNQVLEGKKSIRTTIEETIGTKAFRVLGDEFLQSLPDDNDDDDDAIICESDRNKFMYYVLNYVRDGTRSLLTTNTTSETKEEWPALGGNGGDRIDKTADEKSNMTKSSSQGKNVWKQKRRITITRVSPDKEFPRNPLFSGKTTRQNGQDDTTFSISTTKKITKKRSESLSEALVSPRRVVDVSQRSITPQRRLVLTTPKRTSKSTTTTTPTNITTPITISDNKRRRLERLASLYAAMLLSRTVPNLLVELHLIIRLLTCDHPRRSSKGKSSSNKYLFSCKADCALFGALVIVSIHPVVIGFGRRFVYKIIRTLEYLLDTNRKINEATERVLELLRINYSKSTMGAYASPMKEKNEGIGFALPFRPSTDSRLHFRTGHLMSLYQNRERTRDRFLEILRAYKSASNDLNGSLHREVEERLRGEARQCLDSLMPANFSWFSELVLSELLQVTKADKEPDQQVKRALLAEVGKKNKDMELKLKNLHKRMNDSRPLSSIRESRELSSSRVRLRSSSSSSTTSSFSFQGVVTSSSSSSSTSKTRRILPSSASTTTTATTRRISTTTSSTTTLPKTASEASASSFLGIERFFFLFLLHCDSHALSSHLLRGLASRIRVLEKLSEHQMVSEIHVARHLPERISQLRLLGRFLGLVLFSPNWSTTSDPSYGDTTKMSSALSAALRDDIERANQLSPPLDAVKSLEHAEKRGQLVLTVPWICSFLRMAKLDRVSMGTLHVSNLIRDLRNIRLRTVSRSDGTYGLSTGYVFVLVEIENLFEHFGNEIPETPPPTITKVIPTDNTTGQNTVSLDTLPSIVDTRFLRRCSPFVDDMYRLLSSFNNDIMRGKEGGGNTRRSSLTPRKIRSFPSPISPLTMRSPSDDPRSKFFSENEMKSVQRSLSALSSESNTQTPTKRELAKMRKEAATLRVLTNTFLHHHWQLRTTVEFLSNVLAQNSRDVVNDSVKTVIRSALNINKDDEISHDDARRICKDVSNESDLVDLVNVTVITCMSSAMTDVRKYCHERASTAIRCMAKKDLPEAVLKTAVEIAENRASTSARLLVMSTVRSDVKENMEKIVRRAWRMGRRDSLKDVSSSSTTTTGNNHFDEDAISMWKAILNMTKKMDLLVKNFRKNEVGVNEYFPRWIRVFVSVKSEVEVNSLCTFLATIISTDCIAVEEFLLEALGCVVMSSSMCCNDDTVKSSFVVRTAVSLLRQTIDDKWKLTQLRAEMKVLKLI